MLVTHQCWNDFYCLLLLSEFGNSVNFVYPHYSSKFLSNMGQFYWQCHSAVCCVRALTQVIDCTVGHNGPSVSSLIDIFC